MTIGGIVALMALAAAFALAAVRRRDAFWTATAVVLVISGVLITVRSGLDATFVTNANEAAVIVGAFLLAATVTLGMGMPKALEDRLLLGDMLPEWAFDQALIQARQPIVDAASVGDASVADGADWRQRVTVAAPDNAWSSLADGLSRADAEWSDRRGSGAAAEEWLPWRARTEQLTADWDALRRPVAERRRARATIVGNIFRIGTLAAAACIAVGFLNVAPGTTHGAPEGRAAIVPTHPPGSTVYLAPLGGFPTAELQDLADFYAVRYDLNVDILPRAPIPASLEDPGRGQLAAEDLIGLLRATYSEATDPNRVVIGVLQADIYIRGIPEWQWAFGNRAEGHLAVVSTSRMNATGLFGDGLAASRLRKMVTRDIGVLYFGLRLSSDPHSVLYSEILGVADLDGLGEDF
jgi:predicted Zn-dependent protease